MRKEHVPAEPKSFRPLDFQNDQKLFVRPSTPERPQVDLIQSEPMPTFETELNHQIENTEIILTLKETQKAIQQAIRLGENQIDESTFKELCKIIVYTIGVHQKSIFEPETVSLRYAITLAPKWTFDGYQLYL